MTTERVRITWDRDDDSAHPAVAFEMTYRTPERATRALAAVLEVLAADAGAALREAQP